eukprot:scaffold6378_cov176-Amphora_coffeaeformis.AAC.5
MESDILATRSNFVGSRGQKVSDQLRKCPDLAQLNVKSLFFKQDEALNPKGRQRSFSNHPNEYSEIFVRIG